MTRHPSLVTALLLSWLVIPPGPVGSQEPTVPAGEDTAAQEAAAAAMQEVWEAAASPGEAHAWLAAAAGSWRVRNTWWMEPGKEPYATRAVPPAR